MPQEQLFVEVLQTAFAVIGALTGTFALYYARKHDHGLNGLGPARPLEPAPHPDSHAIEPAVAPAVAAELRARGPIARSRQAEPKAAPVCMCGVPGKSCPVHGVR